LTKRLFFVIILCHFRHDLSTFQRSKLMEWIHFWIGLGFFLNFLALAGALWSEHTGGLFCGEDEFLGGWGALSLIIPIAAVFVGFSEAPQDTWMAIFAFLGCLGITTVVGLIGWGIAEIIGVIINAFTHAEKKTREVIENTQARIARNRERRIQLHESGKLRRSLKDGKVLARAKIYHQENMEALPEDWHKARHHLVRLNDFVTEVLTWRARRGVDVANAARDAKRHKDAKPGTPEHRAHLKACAMCDTFKDRRRFLGALIRELETFLDTIELDIRHFRPEMDGEARVIALIEAFATEHGISLEDLPEEVLDADRIAAMEEVERLASLIDDAVQMGRTPAVSTSSPEPDPKKQAGARKQRQGA
jgi:hypothetical protein